MTAGLETFAKVRALYDRTDSPGEKAAAAGRMEALARSAGLTVDEAMSRLDGAATLSETDLEWDDLWEAVRQAEAAGRAADAPEARSRRWGLPIYDPGKVECWRDVAEHCLQLDWIIPKAHGGRFLTKAERECLKAIARHYSPVTNATADWIETVLARCEAARVSWRDRGKAGARPDRKATQSDIEKAAEMVAAAKRREASKLDTPEPEPQTPAQEAAASLNAFFNRPEFVAQRAEQDRKREVRRAEILAAYGSVEAVYAETEREAALRVACEPMTVWDRRLDYEGNYTLDGWGMFDGREKVPPRVRVAVEAAWPLPRTLTEAWAEFIDAEEHERNRQTMHDYEHHPELWAEVRRYVIEDLLDTLPAASVDDMLMRQSWLEHLNDQGFSRDIQRDTILLATLRADIERMAERMHRLEADAAQGDQLAAAAAPTPDFSPDPGKSFDPVHSGHQRRPTRAERHAAVLALVAEGHTDREVARRLGLSPTTIGNIKRKAQEEGQ